jgi:hypothetical protein
MRVVRRTLLDIFDYSPLRRRIDRFEAWLKLLLLIAILSAPVFGFLAARATFNAGVHAERVQRADRVRTTAVLLQDSAAVAGSRTGPPTTVSAKWTGPDGQPHTGRLFISGGASTGDTVTLWIDAQGRPTDVPQDRAQTLGQAFAVGMFVMAGVVVLLFLLRKAMHRLFEHRRLATWQLEWDLVEPTWSRRT